jgi:tRNA pseudouridine38-40 synthase
MKIALLIEYDGTDFAGWQVQPGVRTVQQDIENAFTVVLQEKVPVSASGRTDAGVHARGMVAHVILPDNKIIGLDKLTEALNGNTGRDIVIRSIREVPDDFHARYSTLDREYRYTISKRRTALYRRNSWFVWEVLDIGSMSRSALALLGEHDFTSFSKRSDDVDHYRSIVEICEFEELEDSIIFTIRANRFVRGMVRSLIGAFVELGKGKLSEDRFIELLNTPTEESRAKYLAPAEGLTLWKIRYPKEYGLWE